jgi:hypothetical protein
MSDEPMGLAEIPVSEEDFSRDSPAIDADGRTRVPPPPGSALSVLWWVDEASLPD